MDSAGLGSARLTDPGMGRVSGAGANHQLVRVLRRAPSTLPALGAAGLFIVWASDRAGYPVTSWAPGGLLVLVLLVVCAVLVPLHLQAVPRPALIAIGALAGYTLWSFVAISWSADEGAALEGADRTLLYLLVFCLFALWRQRGRTAAVLIGLWTLGLTALALVTLLGAASGHNPRLLFIDGRLADPAGYPNAAAATWLMALWPALALASARRAAPWLRGVMAGAAVVLAGVALLSQSRGALVAVPLVVILTFAIGPRRVRTLCVLAPVVAAVGASAPALLEVSTRLNRAGDAAPTIAHAARVLLAAAVLAGLLVAAGAALERYRPLTGRRAHQAHRAIGAAGLCVAGILLIGGLTAAGNPATRISDAWKSFKQGYAENAAGNRLVSGLGSNRYDFYRVGLDRFVARPLQGIGPDNFSQDYLTRRRSGETPRYPHSLEIRTLAETGLVGALLLGTFLVSAFLLAMRAARQREPLASAVAAGALGATVYWVIHGSADWFWEFAGLGAPAFAWLGLACALAPRVSTPFLGVRPLLASARSRALAVLGGLLVLVLLGAPWLAALDIDRAARVWPAQPAQAYARLDRAASLDPLSDQAYLVSGSIAARLGDLERADREFALALERNPGGAYATLERGAIASERGDRAGAIAFLTRAIAQNPRDALARESLAITVSGGRVDVSALNRLILLKAAQIQHP